MCNDDTCLGMLCFSINDVLVDCVIIINNG
jgi:hypothetical protein